METEQIDATKLPPQQPVPDDEISLTDLWLVLVRRKAVFAVAMLVVLIIGFGYALFAPPKYEFTTVIAIGQRYSDGGPEQIESPSALQSEIENLYLPLAIDTYAKQHADFKASYPGGKYPIDVTVPKNGYFVLMSLKGGQRSKPDYDAIAKSVTEKILAQHHKAERVGTVAMAAAMDNFALVINQLNNRSKVLESKLVRLKKMESALETQIASTNRFLGDVTPQELSRKSHADTVVRFLVASEYWSAQQQLTKLEKARIVHIPGEIQRADAELSDIGKQMAAMQKQIDLLGVQAATIHGTHIVYRPDQRDGPNREVVAVLSVVLALMLGVLAAFVAEVISKAREALRVVSR